MISNGLLLHIQFVEFHWIVYLVTIWMLCHLALKDWIWARHWLRRNVVNSKVVCRWTAFLVVMVIIHFHWHFFLYCWGVARLVRRRIQRRIMYDNYIALLSRFANLPHLVTGIDLNRLLSIVLLRPCAVTRRFECHWRRTVTFRVLREGVTLMTLDNVSTWLLLEIVLYKVEWGAKRLALHGMLLIFILLQVCRGARLLLAYGPLLQYNILKHIDVFDVGAGFFLSD